MNAALPGVPVAAAAAFSHRRRCDMLGAGAIAVAQSIGGFDRLSWPQRAILSCRGCPEGYHDLTTAGHPGNIGYTWADLACALA